VDLTVVIPVLNQVEYTRTCLEGLRLNGITDQQIVIVDNASTDGTAEFLRTCAKVRVIRNASNRGCAGAWNQGVCAAPATWTIILNNDVLLPEGWLGGLIGFAESQRMGIVSPASCEGTMDYDFPQHARQFVARMARATRYGIANGACFMVHRRLFETMGLFDDDPRLGGYEDDEFFRRARQRGFRLAITGSSFMHHFGSITQKAIKANLSTAAISLGDRAYYREKYHLTWWKRQRSRLFNKARAAFWRVSERWRFGSTLLSGRQDGQFIWR